MGIFDGYLICSDCDGTLTDSNRVLSKENEEAIKYFQNNGGLFTVATGRYPHYIKEFENQFVPNTYVVGCNGTVIYDLVNDKLVYSEPIAENVLSFLHHVFENLPNVFQVAISSPTDEIYSYIRKGIKIPKEYEEYLINTPTIDSLDEITALHGDVGANRLLLVQHPEYTEANMAYLKKEFSERFSVMRSWNMGLEIQSPKSGKGEMIKKMKEILPNIHTTIGIGDNDNDVSMLEMCDISYAVDNAPREVKEKAKRLTVSCDESAIAKIIYGLL